MNTVSLAKDPFIRKDEGGGGGVTINNQEKSVDITENGVTEVTADSGFTGLSKVVVNTNVQSGGGGGSDMPVIGDGKTYLYITIAAEGRMDVPLYFRQSVANGVTIDWGDGSAPETLSGTGNKNTTHKYAAIGDYVISLDPVDGCTLGLGRNTNSYSIMGSTQMQKRYNCSKLRMVEIGNNVTSIGDYTFDYCSALTSVVIPNGVTSIDEGAFRGCSALTSVVIPNSVTSIGSYAFGYCYALASVIVPNGVTSIGEYAFAECKALVSVVLSNSVTSIGRCAFRNCVSLAKMTIPNSVTSIGEYMLYNCTALVSLTILDGVTSIGNSAFDSCSSLTSVVIPNSVTNISSSAFNNCLGVGFYDFSNHSVVATVSSNAFKGLASDCKIIVPDALYDEWIAATNWSTYASNIIKKSDWDASQS